MRIGNCTGTISAMALASLAATGCGGGGGLLEPDYVSWTDNANGEVVVDANNEEFRVSAQSRQVEDRSGKQASGLTVDSSGRILDGGTQVGGVQLVPGANGGSIAAFYCSDGTKMDITFRVDNTYSYSCEGAGSGNGSGAGGSGGGSGNGAPSYLRFNGNSNDTVVLDRDNERFEVDATTRNVVDRSGTRLSDLTVDAAANVVWKGSVIGVVTLADGSSGSKVAVFLCSDGNNMDITVSVQQWSYGCGSGGPAGGGSSNAGNNGGAPTRSFITWNGSSNGESVVDASGDFFKFNSATRCLYSENRNTEYNNFCLTGQNTVFFAGNTYSVTRVLSTANTCIAALTTDQGDYADIVTGTDRVDRIQGSGRRPARC